MNLPWLSGSDICWPSRLSLHCRHLHCLTPIPRLKKIRFRGFDGQIGCRGQVGSHLDPGSIHQIERLHSYNDAMR